MNKVLIYSLIFLAGVIVSSFSQIVLKKSANKQYDKWYKEYLNVRVIAAYSMFFLATICSVFAYKYVPLSMGPILGATEYVLVSGLSWMILKEKIGRKKLLGLIVIVAGVLIYTV